MASMRSSSKGGEPGTMVAGKMKSAKKKLEALTAASERQDRCLINSAFTLNTCTVSIQVVRRQCCSLCDVLGGESEMSLIYFLLARL